MASDGTYFDTDTKLMLHMDGADGSTTFTDSSDSARVVSTFGTVQIDTAQSVFGGASGLFDGDSDYLTIPYSTDFDFGSGDWTIDFRARFASAATVYDIWSPYVEGSGGFIARIYPASGGDGYLSLYNDSPSEYRLESLTFALNTWYHFAFVVSSNRWYMFRDGTLINSGGTAVAGTFNADSNTIQLGRRSDGQYYMNGWLDEFRVVKGTAVWTSNFTPPSAAYIPPATASSISTRRVFMIT